MVQKLVWQLGLVAFLAFPLSAQENRIEVSPFVGYTFSEGVATDPNTIGGTIFSEVNLKSGFSYGVTIGVFATEQVEIAFLWSQQDSVLEGGGVQTRDFTDMTVSNYHGIFSYNFGTEDDMMRPFLFGGVGATSFNPSDIENFDIDGETKFSSTWGVGIKAYPGEHVGFQIMGRWTPTYIKSDPAGIWCSPYWYGYGGGCHTLSDPDYANQLELTGGVIFRF